MNLWNLWGLPEEERMDLWGLLWHSRNRLNGLSEYIMWRSGRPLLFDTRADARRYAQAHYGYITQRADLRSEPHGWRLPRPVKVVVTVRAKARPKGRGEGKR